MFKCCMKYHDGPTGVGLLVLRVIAGLGMMLHGVAKIRNPFAWMGAESPVPGFLQAMAAFAEFVGGMCWVVGLGTPVFSTLIAATMVVAAVMAHIAKGHPFVNKPGQPCYELAAIYLSIAVLLLLAGPGRHSVDRVLFDRKSEDDDRPIG